MTFEIAVVVATGIAVLVAGATLGAVVLHVYRRLSSRNAWRRDRFWPGRIN